MITIGDVMFERNRLLFIKRAGRDEATGDWFITLVFDGGVEHTPSSPQVRMSEAVALLASSQDLIIAPPKGF